MEHEVVYRVMDLYFYRVSSFMILAQIIVEEHVVVFLLMDVLFVNNQEWGLIIVYL